MGTGTESIWQLLTVASPFAKFVLMILGIMSLLSWTVILDKVVMWMRVRKDSKGFEGYNWRQFEPRGLFGEARRYATGFPRARLHVRPS
jgi:biopolymer transport protein ExbB/TolQ